MFLSPLQMIRYAGVHPGMHVADFGSGRGEYSFPLHERLQNEGTLYTLDIVPDIVEHLARERMHRAIDNFFPMCVDLNKHLPFKDALLHCAVLSNTLHALVERDAFLNELHRVMKPDGRVLFVDWASSFKNMGPVQEHVITPGNAVRLFESNDFKVGAMIPQEVTTMRLQLLKRSVYAMCISFSFRHSVLYAVVRI